MNKKPIEIARLKEVTWALERKLGFQDCPHCGKPFDPIWNYCAECGTPAKEEEGKQP